MTDRGVALMWDEREEGFDRAIEWLMVALLAFMPVAFGAVEAWSEEIVLGLAAALSVCFLVKAVFLQSARLTWTWAYVPVGIFVLLVVMQMVPMPSACTRFLSSNTAALKSELLRDLPNAKEYLSSMTISFYSHATWHDLRLVLACVAIFVVVLNVYRRPEQIKHLLGAVAVIGGAVALLAMAQDIFGNDKIYWFVISPHGEAHSGPFVSHSHYGQFMNLTMGAVIGLIFVNVHESFVGRRVTPQAVAAYCSAPETRRVWALCGIIVLGVVTVLLSLTRGGMISMLVAGAFTTLVLSSRRSMRGSGWVMALLALGAFICVLYIGFDAVYDRLTTLGDLDRAEGGRWQILKDIAVAWTKFPLLGTGLGTHEIIYPMFDRSTIPALAAHAENEYAQTTEETGILGLITLTVFGVLVWIHYVRVVRSVSVPIQSAAYGLGFGLVAILVHSLSDFGQHVPANAVLTTIFCALLIRLSRVNAEESEGIASPERHVQRHWVGGLVVVGIVCAWALVDADGARRAEAQWTRVLAAERNLQEKGWQGPDEEYRYLLSHAIKAADAQPDSVKYRHWLNVYRWHAISRVTDPNTGDVVLPKEAVEFAGQIVAGLNDTRALCPTFGATWCVLGQLERSVLGRLEEGARHIREGVRLAPCDATARFVAGTLAAEEDQMDLASEHLKVAVRLDPLLFGEVADLLISRFGQPDLALQIAGESIHKLSIIADVLETLGDNMDSAEHVREKLVTLLEQQCQEPTAPARALASLAHIYRKDGRVTEAIECYRRALSLQYGMVDWRFSLARLYAEAGAVDKAIEEARVCLRFRPEHMPSRQLIERLSTELPFAEQRH